MAKFRSARAANADIERTLDAVVNHFLDDFYTEVKSTTPVREGRAKRAWRQTGKYDITRKGETTVMRNDTPYVGLLDEGSSKQAPRGMTTPAFEKLSKRRFRKI